MIIKWWNHNNNIHSNKGYNNRGIIIIYWYIVKLYNNYINTEFIMIITLLISNDNGIVSNNKMTEMIPNNMIIVRVLVIFL